MNIIDNYIMASKYFNEQYEETEGYRVDIFLDLDFLHIYIKDLKNEYSYKIDVLNNLITDLTVSECFEVYEELMKKLKENKE